MAKPYQAPLPLIRLALNQAAEISGARALPGYEEVLKDLAEPVLENASRFAGDVLSPLNPVGDRVPARCEAHGIVTSPGFVEAYRRFCADGWVSLAAPAEHGGQALPTLLSAAVTEMWGGANLSFAMCPELTLGALGALRVHAPAELIDTYAGRITSGEWATAMCLTEPQAGSDLSTVRTRAEPDGAAWRLYGRKIYISWGDHDLTDNIVHFVLARTPDAPQGLKGISLFLVPKKIPGVDGALTRNDIEAVSVEHKMGIRASPTCVMVLGEHGGARGWLVGKLHDGLGCMFTMMNHMRLGVGLHSLGLAERSLQLARDYARERLQGRNPSGAQRPIIEHADVRRMLLLMKSLTQAARGLAYTAAATLDVAHSAEDPSRRAAATHRADLLTPVVKAWCSDVAVEVASLGVQVHGGAGFVDDAEISQVYRDARIGPIFEGTNYIQAQDLLGRKILRDHGKVLGELLAEIEEAAQSLVPGATNAHDPAGRLTSGAASSPTQPLSAPIAAAKSMTPPPAAISASAQPTPPTEAISAAAQPTAPPTQAISASAQPTAPPTEAISAAAQPTAPPTQAASTSAQTMGTPTASLSHLRSGLLTGCARLRQAAAELIERSPREPDLIGATAYNFLQWLGILAGGWQLALSATRAPSELNSNEARAVVDLAAFYGAHVLPRASVHEAVVRNGTEAVTNAATADL